MVKKIRKNILITGLCALLGSVVSTYADSNTDELLVFTKCYSDLTGTRVSSDHPYVSQVASGELKADEACMNLFSMAELTSSGLTVAEQNSYSSTDQEIARSILQNFYRNHRTWFPSDDIQAGISQSFVGAEEDIYDRYQAANQVSYLLFSDQNYQNLLRGTQTVKSIREVASPATGVITGTASTSFVHDQGVLLVDPSLSYVDLPKFSPLLIQEGELRGFKPLTSAEQSQFIWIPTSIGNSVQSVVRTNYLKGYGGGALGSASYFLLNSGLGRAANGAWYYANGTSRIARRWSNSILKDFMCRDLPVVQYSDVAQYTRPESSLPYRQGPSCVQCHATMDSMGAIARNLSPKPSTFVYVAPPNDLLYRSSVHVTQMPTSPIPGSALKPDGNPAYYQTDPSAYLTAEDDYFAVESDGQFYRRPPNGRLIMRDWSGNLTDKEIVGLEELGQELTQIDDYYMCAAQRYYQFFTGDTEPNFTSSASSDEEVESSRQAIIEWGRQLRSGQSLKALIRSIFQSDIYRRKALEK